MIGQSRTKPRDGAIVIGGDYRGLGVVRSLGRHGVPVWVLAGQHRVASFSRYCHRSLPWPSGSDDERVRLLLDLASRHGLEGWMLFPTADVTASFIARRHEELSRKFLLTTPPWEELKLAYDKRLIHSLAAELGISQPWTRSPANRREVEEMECTFPAILKPAVKVEGFNPFIHSKAWRVNSREQLLARYDEASKLVDPNLIMVQELIPSPVGCDFSFSGLCADGNPLAFIVTWRARQHPIEFGQASTYVETVERPEVERPARKLLAALRYTGIVDVGFILDPRDNRYKLLDLNPRAWGSHTLGRRAGVDFVYLLWQLIRNEPINGGRGRTGVKWMRLLTDLPTVARMFWRGLLSPKDYLSSLFRGPMEFAIFAPDDPIPALVDAPLLASLVWKRRRVQKELGRRGPDS